MLAFRLAEVAALAALAWTTIRIGRDADRITSRTIALEARAEAAVVDARRVVLSVGGTAAEVRKTSATTRAAAIEQRELLRITVRHASETLSDTDAAVRAMHDAVLATNENLNVRLMPQLSTLASDAHRDLVQLEDVERNLARAAAGMSEIANSPDITRSIANIQAGTEDVRQALDMAVAKERQLMRPGNFAWHLFRALLRPAADGAQIYQAIH
jgi:hypothetical protein